MLELDPPGHRSQGGRGRCGDRLGCGGSAIGCLLRGVEELEHALGRGQAGLQHVHLGRDLGDRHGELPRVLDERLDVAQRYRPRGDPPPAEHRDHHVVEVAEELHRWHDHPGQELRPEAGLEQLLVLAAELLDHRLAAAERQHQPVPGVSLLDQPVQRAGPFPLVRELGL